MAMSRRKRSSCPRSDRLVECSQCGRLHGRSERSCGRCGAPVRFTPTSKPEGAPSGEASKVRPEYAVGPLVHAASGANQVEAEMIQALLLEEGVPSIIRRSPGFDVPEFLAAGPREVLVCKSAQMAASEALLNAEVAQSEPTPPPTLAHAAVLFAVIVLVAFCGSMIAWLL